MKEILLARQAILDELKRRYQAGDKTVKPRDKGTSAFVEDDDGPTNFFSGAGEMPCPVCKTGTLRYSRAGYNGHVHAHCSTSNCVDWME